MILVQHDFVDVAPAPIFAGLEGSNDRVLRGVKMFCCVAIFRRITAADVAASQAHTQVNPSPAHLETFFAAGRRAMNPARHFIGYMVARIRKVDRIVVLHGGQG